jgi:hypothetical protein
MLPTNLTCHPEKSAMLASGSLAGRICHQMLTRTPEASAAVVGSNPHGATRAHAEPSLQ